MESEIKIRHVLPSDLDNLVKLYETIWPDVFYDKKSKAEYVLVYSTGINYCAESDDEIVGSRTSVYQNFFYGKRKLNCLQLGDSCVHPKFQGKGLFQNLNRNLLRDFFETGNGELIFNISVDKSRRSYEKLGWVYIESLMTLRKIIRPFHILYSTKFNLRKLFLPPVPEEVNKVSDIEENLYEIREKLFEERNLLHIKYDAQVFNWRLKSYSGINTYVNKKLGCVVYKTCWRGNLKEVTIGEVFLYDFNNYKSFNKLLKVFVNFLNPDILTVCVSEGHPLKSWYKKCGFHNDPRKKYLNHGVKVVSDEMKSICLNPDNWAISNLDIDTF